MMRVKIKKQGTITHQADFLSREKAEEWANQNAATGAFGKIERWLYKKEFSSEKISDALESRDPAAMGLALYGANGELQYRFAQEFLVEYLDVTVEVDREKKLSDRLKKRQFGAFLIDKIAVMLEAKGTTPQQTDDFLMSIASAGLKAHLEVGNIETFIFKLRDSDVAAFFTLDEKAAVISECENFLFSLGG